MMFKCPYPGCDFISSTLFGLKTHFKQKHRGITVCPVCGKYYRNLYAHVKNKAKYDEKHLIFYYLLSNNRRSKELINKAREYCFIVLRV